MKFEIYSVANRDMDPNGPLKSPLFLKMDNTRSKQMHLNREITENET
jgi:hypothetical protein